MPLRPIEYAYNQGQVYPILQDYEDKILHFTKMKPDLSLEEVS